MGIKITNDSDRPTLYIYGDIGGWYGGVTPDDLRMALADVPRKSPINVRINSDGGVFEDGVAMRALLKAHQGEVGVYVDGLAASAASLIAMGGDTIEMAQGSWMMIHEARAVAGGTAKELRKLADQLEVINGQIVGIYGARWKGEGSIEDALAAETWLPDNEAVAVGLADHVASDSIPIAAHVDANKASAMRYNRVPDALRQVPPDYTRYEAGLQLLNEAQSQPQE